MRAKNKQVRYVRPPDPNRPSLPGTLWCVDEGASYIRGTAVPMRRKATSLNISTYVHPGNTSGAMPPSVVRAL